MFFAIGESLLSTRNRLLALTDWCRACVTYRLSPKLLNPDLCATLASPLCVAPLRSVRKDARPAHHLSGNSLSLALRPNESHERDVVCRQIRRSHMAVLLQHRPLAIATVEGRHGDGGRGTTHRVQARTACRRSHYHSLGGARDHGKIHP